MYILVYPGGIPQAVYLPVYPGGILQVCTSHTRVVSFRCVPLSYQGWYTQGVYHSHTQGWYTQGVHLSYPGWYTLGVHLSYPGWYTLGVYLSYPVVYLRCVPHTQWCTLGGDLCAEWSSFFFPVSLLVGSSLLLIFPFHCWSKSLGPYPALFPFHCWASFPARVNIPVSLLVGVTHPCAHTARC